MFRVQCSHPWWKWCRIKWGTRFLFFFFSNSTPFFCYINHCCSPKAQAEKVHTRIPESISHINPSWVSGNVSGYQSVIEFAPGVRLAEKTPTFEKLPHINQDSSMFLCCLKFIDPTSSTGDSDFTSILTCDIDVFCYETMFTEKDERD